MASTFAWRSETAGLTHQQQDGHVRACEHEQQHGRREDQQQGRDVAGRPLCLHQRSYEGTRVPRKAVRGLLGELLEERLKSLLGHAWRDAPLETGVDIPRDVRIERQVHRNEDLRTGLKVVTWQHANHGVGFAVQVEGLPHCLRPPAEVSLPEPIGEHDDPLRLLAHRPVRLVEDSPEEWRNPKYVQAACRKSLGAHRFREVPAAQRHVPGVRDEGAVQDLVLLKGDELSPRDNKTLRRALVQHAKPDDPIDVGEWERIQECRMHDAEQPRSGGNPDCHGDDSRCGETVAPAEDTQRLAHILPAVFEPYAPPHVPDSVFHLPNPTEFQSCRPSCSGVLHAGCAIFVNQ
jgi:hypothetical protein